MAHLSNTFLEPGTLVENPKAPAWGLGQVQSNIDGKITVNFEHQGKVVIIDEFVMLRIVSNYTP